MCPNGIVVRLVWNHAYESRRNEKITKNYGTKDAFVRHAKNSRERKGGAVCLDVGNLVFSQETSFPVRNPSAQYTARLVSSVCVIGEPFSSRMCVLHINIYTYIFVIRNTQRAMRARWELDLSFFQLMVISYIFSSPKVICIAYRLQRHWLHMFFVRSRALPKRSIELSLFTRYVIIRYRSCCENSVCR